MKTPALIRFALTAIVVLVAALLAHALWRHYMLSPWTRDGRVRAEVVRIAPDVSGLVDAVAVRDNQHVKRGDLLFSVDRKRYELALEKARANLAVAQAQARAAGASLSAAAATQAASEAEFQMRRAQAERRARAAAVISAEARSDAEATARSAQADVHRSAALRGQATAAQAQAVASVEQAQAALDLAELDLQRTQVRATADGYITNLEVRVGDYAQAGGARLALVRDDAMWVYGYFEETKLPRVHVGDRADIRLMSGGLLLHGQVEGIARGIADSDNPTGTSLLADVSPTFNWIRLAQRVPVRIRIDPASVPQGTLLAAGMTATVSVHPRQD
ncbi:MULTISPECIES: biotin/lipoyl-binding protein [Xanthomonas]|uniref:HlyD family secretion protein n=1 Tax=Xanthomonas rydalmerensis TaxID=3046274 RepID=A0ABZ0JRI8_9XANT|nr:MULTISPECIES: HlyD family secretion protein [unclassified Xanthomonas]MBB5943197.1 multidrug resistance efflux pump [Xanthomonas sp. 3307]WOS42415.1 HlyD family secretion protein [Xanthomonas sp. DM-2023]WOS46601.1 HlyD family secretion protein [Xanthomonas sp. DM-2023]WOS50781.1 HlyD family secretion protein [Xanthomonas sp. DM-2023]WOS54961.1 HlyD family secretion protein [Xanthomonas sp. DM-2023]